ncbi:MAG TPA: sodium:proton antiporter [Phycisphaerae bacterium]|nr:sodium:proton antiporter [Phycisphaerae bacterium]HOJ75484.1 sodium:proton antiporter [Phycisphaerae bacterium]HOM52284.1 sodium:proton antiporter [Phycisphaerae bacterium]HON66264.1 sodium:proton antiporter [Phycisphaerae bacterium]HOQ84608.1 sodium:proton antiporter [Phycisphaerae bacterium]
MTHGPLVGLAAILVLGTMAQWLAWRLRVPSILLLLLVGFVAGPISGFINPDELLGDLLFPVVSLSVGIILFEGGMNLRLVEWRHSGPAVRNLVTIGAAITWLGSTLAAHWLVGTSWDLSLLLGAILVVSGPTVILPILQHIRPSTRVGSILKWEAILIDPIGAALAVLVFEVIAAQTGTIGQMAALIIVRTLAIGIGIGIAGAALVILFIRRFWIPDHLENMTVLTVVVLAFIASNLIQGESGLLTVTVMGIALANQQYVRIRHIVEFKENLRMLLLSVLFILLASRLQPEYVRQIDTGSILFLLTLILIVRPVGTLVSTMRLGLGRNERMLIAAMAPRGVVAASVASVFAMRLEELGRPEGKVLIPLTFLVIVGTVTAYGLAAAPLSRRLGVAFPQPQGVLFIGAHRLSRLLAGALRDKGFLVHLVDTNWQQVAAAKLENLPATCANILSDYALRDLELWGIGRLMALTANDEVNSLAVLHFADEFERAELYQLAPNEQSGSQRQVSHELRGRILFHPQATFAEITARLEAGATLKKTTLSREFDYNAFRARHGDSALPLFIITADHQLVIVTASSSRTPRPGETLIYLADGSSATKGGE